MMKRLISRWQEKAVAADREAQDALRRGGGRQNDVTGHEREAEYHYPLGRAEANLPQGA